MPTFLRFSMFIPEHRSSSIYSTKFFPRICLVRGDSQNTREESCRPSLSKYLDVSKPQVRRSCCKFKATDRSRNIRFTNKRKRRQRKQSLPSLLKPLALPRTPFVRRKRERTTDRENDGRECAGN